ncbi:hypothetical protein [Georgenia sunbinii]|uniref:hypothetical protein n=1 Tax=Georgenia sunbinii TaxID=3117728 RepID=UPI002F25F2FF
MSGADSLLPPEAYSWWVPALGGGLLLLVALWFTYVLLSTRRPDPTKQPPMTGDARGRYEIAVDGAVADYRSGELDLRSLHLRLARLMRDFASDRIGRDVRPWTRSEIAAHDPTARIGHLLAVWEEPSFARRSDAEAETAADQAREVIQQW